METQKITATLQIENETIRTQIKDLTESITKVAEQIDK